MNKCTLFALVAATTLFSGCAAVDKATGVYGAAKAAVGARSAYTMAKDLKNSAPAFQGYSSVVVTAEVHPRQDRVGFPETFRQNVMYLVKESAIAFEAPVAVCPAAANCGGQAIGVNFREKAFGETFVEKITWGDRLKGVLSYVDLQTGQVLASTEVSGSQTYAELMNGIRGSIGFTMLKSFPPPNGQANERMDRANKIPSIRPDLKGQFDIS